MQSKSMTVRILSSKKQVNIHEIGAGLGIEQLFAEIGRTRLKDALSQSIRHTSRRDLKISPELCLPYLGLLANAYNFPLIDPEMCALIAQRKFKSFARSDNRRAKFEVSVS